jgi:uncharacterized membrane protein
MPESLLPGLTLLAVLGCAAMGGVFFAFSTFVMKALGVLRPAEGIRAMQSINRVVLNPLFLGVFQGTALLCLALGVLGWSSPFRLTGALLYLIGTFGVTIFGNVPWNERLKRVDSEGQEGAALWESYLIVWTRWNHARTVAALGACALFFLDR